MRNRYYKDLSYSEKELWNDFFYSELRGLDFKHPIRTLHLLMWNDFQNNKFSTDGATFVKERCPDCPVDLAAMIHDWRNSNGYVGKIYDKEMLDIMVALRYDESLIFERKLYMMLGTWINVIRHKIMGNLKKDIPSNVYKEPSICLNPYNYR